MASRVTPPRIVTCPGTPAAPCTSAIDPDLVPLCSRCRARKAASEPALTRPAEPGRRGHRREAA